MGGETTGGGQDVFADKIAVRDRFLLFQNDSGPSMGQNREFSRQHSVGRKIAGIQMGLGDSHHITRIVDIDLQMRGTGLVFYTAVSIVTENRC